MTTPPIKQKSVLKRCYQARTFERSKYMEANIDISRSISAALFYFFLKRANGFARNRRNKNFPWYRLDNDCKFRFQRITGPGIHEVDISQTPRLLSHNRKVETVDASESQLQRQRKCKPSAPGHPTHQVTPLKASMLISR